MSLDGFQVTLTQNGTTFTFAKVGFDTIPRIDEDLDKDLHMHKGGMGEGIAVLQDHLRNTHGFVLTLVFKSEPGVKSAWEKRREFINAMQYTGGIWQLNFTETGEGIDETYNVACKKVSAHDLGGSPKVVRLMVQFIQTKDLSA